MFCRSGFPRVIFSDRGRGSVFLAAGLAGAAHAGAGAAVIAAAFHIRGALGAVISARFSFFKSGFAGWPGEIIFLVGILARAAVAKAGFRAGRRVTREIRRVYWRKFWRSLRREGWKGENRNGFSD